MEIVFSKGSGHHGEPPTATEVMESLALDAGGYDAASGFEDWAQEYGMDPDSRSAERAFHAVGKQVEDLRHFLGSAYNAIMVAILESA